MNKPLPVPGYTDQGDAQIDMVSQNKLIEEIAMRQIDAHVREHGSSEIDQRMVALARTKMQESFMWLNRAVFQPTRINGDIEIKDLPDRLFK